MSDLVLYYSFDAGGVPIPDDSGNGNLGIPAGAAFTGEALSGRAMDFDSASDVVSVSNATGIAFNRLTSFTICAWVNQRAPGKSVNGESVIIRKDSGANGLVVLELNYPSEGDIRFHYGTRPVTSTTNVVDLVYETGASIDNQWLFICGVRDVATGQAKIFLNGEEVASAADTIGTRWTVTSGEIVVGNHFVWSPLPFDGKMDELRVYMRALSAAEIKELYKAVPRIHIAPAVELAWKSLTGRVYQVQQSSDSEPGVWRDLGGPVEGNGTTNIVYDPITGRPNPSYYRVLTSP